MNSSMRLRPSVKWLQVIIPLVIGLKSEEREQYLSRLFADPSLKTNTGAGLLLAQNGYHVSRDMLLSSVLENSSVEQNIRMMFEP